LLVAPIAERSAAELRTEYLAHLDLVVSFLYGAHFAFDAGDGGANARAD
jgi:hypothetical protein